VTDFPALSREGELIEQISFLEQQLAAATAKVRRYNEIIDSLLARLALETPLERRPCLRAITQTRGKKDAT